MDTVTPAQVIQIERRIVSQMVQHFGLDCSGLVLDITNFATYIDSGNDKAPIAQRGHAKQTRTICDWLALDWLALDWLALDWWSQSTAASPSSPTPTRVTTQMLGSSRSW